MSTCNQYLPGGNVTCKVAMAKVKRVYLADSSLSFASLSAVYSYANWKAAIDTDLELFVSRGNMGYEVTTDDPNIITTEETQKLISNRPAPSAVVYLDSNFCDYLAMVNVLKGGSYAVIYELADGSIYMKRNTDGTFVPFPARLSAIGKGIPEPSDIQNNYKMYINHIDYKDFEMGALITPDWLASDLQLEMPLGTDLKKTSVYLTGGAGTFGAYITDRCGDGRESLAVADFEVISSNFLDTPAVTVVADDGDGNYTITLQKDAVPANLDAGDYITIRVKALDGTIVDYLSNHLTIIAPAA